MGAVLQNVSSAMMCVNRTIFYIRAVTNDRSWIEKVVNAAQNIGLLPKTSAFF
jgi:hypothetical protein